jgi:hypothetical protein
MGSSAARRVVALVKGRQGFGSSELCYTPGVLLDLFNGREVGRSDSGR